MKSINFSALLVFLLLIVSCTQSPDLKKQTEAFYSAMNAHDHAAIVSFYADSVRVIGNDYRSVYTKEVYLDWVQWDSVFNPTYEILSLTELDNAVEVQVRKTDPRILFLNEAPFITTERLNFKNGQLQSLEILAEDYHMELWISKRAALVDWIAEHHPELDRFIHDQSKLGAQNYMKAIDHFKNRKTE